MFSISVAIELIVQHIREFLSNRQKAAAQKTPPDSSNSSPSHQTARRVNSNEGSLKRPH